MHQAPFADGHANAHTPPRPKLLDQVRAAIRLRHYSLRTEQAYIHSIKRFIVVRAGKGNKDRMTTLPSSVKEPLSAHLKHVRELHQQDIERGFGKVYLPYALERKYPNANREWGWQWVFPASQISVDPRSGVRRRHHLHESVLQKGVKAAAKRAGLHKPIGCHSLRHSFATHSQK